VWTLIPGVPIGCRSPRKRGPYSMPIHTHQDWTANVGALAAGHRLLRFSIATALAGTLLDIGGFESGCFHFFGKSSEGKTTSLRMAASVWGSGADGGYVRTWRATANGLEAAFAGASDTCLPLDELGRSKAANSAKRCIWPRAASESSVCGATRPSNRRTAGA
jgi:putative DNA primase/helicase